MNPTARPSIAEFNAARSGSALESKSLELLFEYTKFHIGVYLTLTSVYVAIATLEINDKLALAINPYLLGLSILATMLAGLAGGVIIGSITQIESSRSSEFLECAIGPWELKRCRFHARKWTYVEHTSFWIGLISAVLSFIWT